MSVQAWYTRTVGDTPVRQAFVAASKGVPVSQKGMCRGALSSDRVRIERNMPRILFGLMLVVIALIQATILPRVNPISVYPDLVLVLLFVWSTTRSMRESLFWIFFTGILLDVLAFDFFGTNALSLVIVVVLAGLARRRILLANVLIPITLMAVATVLHGVALALLRGDPPVGWFIPFQALIHAVMIPVIYIVLRVFGR